MSIVRILLITLMTCAVWLPTTALAAGCEEYEAEAEAISGVIPKFNEDGTVRAIIAHGEATFLTDKRSLINSARKKAELAAKAAFSNFLSESVSSETKAASMLEAAEKTDADGNTEGYATELNAIVETMASNTSAVLNGIVKLDECVDTSGKYILVTLGWKPAVDNKSTAPVSVALSNSEPMAQNAVPSEIKIADAAQKNEPDGCVSGLNLTTVESTGYGKSQNLAVDDGIRIAISQVFGEVFASSMTNASSSISAEISDEKGNNDGVVLEISAQDQASSSLTSGVVESFLILNTDKDGNDFKIDLKVTMPKYCFDNVDNGKKKIVVLRPEGIATKTWTQEGETLAEIMMQEIEGLLNETINFTVLNRSGMSEINNELNTISGADFAISEIAKQGNKMGADYLVITEFSDFDTKRKKIKIGAQKTVNMYLTSAQAWIKVVDVVSTNLLASIRVPLSSKSVEETGRSEAFSLTMAHNLAVVVGNGVGGGFNENGKAMLEASSQKIDNYTQAKDRLEKKIKDIKESANGLW